MSTYASIRHTVPLKVVVSQQIGKELCHLSLQWENRHLSKDKNGIVLWYRSGIAYAQKNKTYYYRAYLIVDGNIYYGDVMEASTEEPDEAAILGEWYMASHHLTPYVPKDDEELPSLGNPQLRNYAPNMIQKRK